MLSPKDGNPVSLSIDAENPATRQPAKTVIMNRKNRGKAVVRETIVAEIPAKVGQTEGLSRFAAREVSTRS